MLCGEAPGSELSLSTQGYPPRAQLLVPLFAANQPGRGIALDSKEKSCFPSKADERKAALQFSPLKDLLVGGLAGLGLGGPFEPQAEKCRYSKHKHCPDI